VTVAALRERWSTRRDLLVLLALLGIAALLRLPGLATRGTWDADQGHDMLVLRAFVRDGITPLLGPPTSLGDVHHGALYYYLLAPAAALTGGDSPLAVVAEIAIAGIAAVGVTWWLARSIAGSIAGRIAGLVMAVSIAAIDESTFLWNPNLIALSSSIALAGAWRALTTQHPRWWLLAGAGTAVTMQCHILGIALVPIVGAALVADFRRRTDRGDRRAVLRAGLGALAIVLAAYLPLVLNELTQNFSETRAALAYLASDREAGAAALPTRFGIVGLRVVSWPLVGLITDAFVPAVLSMMGIVGVALWRRDAPAPEERFAVRWLALGLLWTVLFLAVAAPTLAAVVRGLPNDHYHAFADPLVFVMVGLGVAAAVKASRAGAIGAGIVVVALLGWNILHLPPGVHPDGGFPAAEGAAARIVARLAGAGVPADATIVLRSLPAFKSTEAYGYPLIRAGAHVDVATPQGRAVGSWIADASGTPPALVVVCDRTFETAIGAPCGGPAESADPDTAPYGSPVDRFEAAPGRVITIYTTGHANAGAPDAGVRCPRDPDGGGRSGSCPGGFSVATGLVPAGGS